MYINKTIFEIVSPNTRIELHRVIRQIDPSCELLSDDSVDVSQKNRFTFSTSLGEEKAEEVLRGLIKDDQLRISEFQMSRPDLETIFLRATKKNWEDQDYLGRKKKLKQQATAVG